MLKAECVGIGSLSLGLRFDAVESILAGGVLHICAPAGTRKKGKTKQVGLSAANNKRVWNSHCQVLLLLLDAAVGGLGVLCW